MVEMLIQDMAVGQCLNIEQIFETKMPGTINSIRAVVLMMINPVYSRTQA